ncbi:hypothetical protein, partial [Escherichia coli]|uniref:hypothetical protein n=1 Tax=Escherichia coli TaxID=562 RepID=UPI003EE12199
NGQIMPLPALLRLRCSVLFLVRLWRDMPLALLNLSGVFFHHVGAKIDSGSMTTGAVASSVISAALVMGWI